MDKNSKVGIIVPIYNTADFLRECLDSIVSQTHKDFVAILVDDDSSDKECVKIALSYVLADSRFILFTKENGGQGSAKNLGIEYCLDNIKTTKIKSNSNLNEYLIPNDNYNAKKLYTNKNFTQNKKADYIIFADSDDILEPNWLKECVENIGVSQLIWYDFVKFYDKVKPKSEPTDLEIYGYKQKQIITPKEWLQKSKEVKKHSFASGCFVMIRADFLKDIDLKFLHCFGEDNHFGILLFLNAKQITILPKKLYRYRIRKDSSINYGGQTSIKAIPKRLKAHLSAFLGNPMMLQKYYRAGSSALMLSEIFKFMQNYDEQLNALLKDTFLNRLAMLGLNLDSFIADPLGYKKYLPQIKEYAKERDLGAYALLHQSLEYQLGSHIISSFKSFDNLIKAPRSLFMIYNFYRQNKITYDLSSYNDYDYAAKLKNHLSYKIGNLILRRKNATFKR